MNAAGTRNELVEKNLGLVHSCANRFRGRGVDYDDLFGAGCVGLIKAADGFDPTRGFAFSTYAVPAILGEIRRIFRDGGSVKVGRSAKDKARLLLQIREKLQENTGRDPTVQEVAAEAGMEPAEAAQLIYAVMPPISLTAEREDEQVQLDIPVESSEQSLLEHMALRSAMSLLEERDRRLIELRYFKGMTQTVTADQLGMTQVQVSRREKAILAALRRLL